MRGARVVGCVVAAALALSGCSAALDFHECNTSADCNAGVGDGGLQLFCTSDHLCADPTPCAVSTQVGSGKPLVVAGLYKLSGPGSDNDHAIRQAGDLAAQELGTLGRSVEYVVCDTAADPATAARALQVSVDVFGAVAIVGPDTSDEVVKGVATVVKDKGAVVVSPAATNPAIAQLDDGGLIWRTAPSDDVQSRVLAQLIPTTAKLDLVYVDMNTYATGVEQAFTAAWHGTVGTPIVFETGQAAMAIARMDQPDYALLIAHVDAPDLVAQAQAQQATALSMTTQLFFTDAALAPSLYGNGPYDYSFLGRIKGTAPGIPTNGDPSEGVYNAFNSAFRAHFNGEDPGSTAWVANAYDAFYIIALAAGAVEASGHAVTGRAIAAQLRRVSTAGAPTINAGTGDFLKGIADLASGDIDFVGASGPDDFDAATGDVLTAPIEEWTIVDGGGTPKFSVLQTITP